MIVDILPPVIVSLQGNIDDDSRAVKELLGNLASIHALTSDRKWKLRCQECRYLGPWATAVLATAYLEGVRREQSPRVQLPQEPPPLRSFCAYSGMEKLFRNGPLPDPDHPECEVIALERFTTASWDRSNRLIKLIHRHTGGLTLEFEDQIRACVQEVIQNIYDHAKSPIGGVLAGRYMATSREVRVGIVDRGLGIAETLRAKYPDTTSSRLALTRVIQGKFSSKSRPSNMGLGVSNLFGLVQNAGGRMAIFTGNSYAEVHPPMERPVVYDTGCEFPGTAVFFTLPVTT